uniref:adhesion G protein-coupled receptor L2-like isoform X1 n=1 Tax=Styela clava TaxID=7725 RepID=UPI001939DBA4|nr:adhesion G protein-coupled receptor L2-like isoform X1 [Styela clava]
MKKNTKWILQLFILGICWAHVKSNTDWAFGGFPMRNEMACEKYPISLRCPGHDVIQIVSAEYGRQNTFTCSASTGEMKNVKCSLPGAKSIMAEKCNNRTQCSFEVSTANFPDPCPETHKYLKTSFNCVKYMFGCPGSLTGIGSEIVTAVEIQPQSGTWTKDPLSSPDHVFFMSSSQQIIQEYRNWDDFVTGNPSYRYNLPSKAAPGNIVVYDRNLYYVKANSRSIIRYSLITQRRTKETVIQAESGIPQNRDISLSVDENGLWVIYPRQRGLIAISKLDKDQLTLSKTWNTNLRTSESLHTFIICGVLYSVSSSTGQIDYFYNTNLKQEKRGIRISFDADQAYNFRRRTRSRTSFRRYNATSVSYNPRDQLLYIWDGDSANAVYYKLHFDSQDPSKPHVVTTTRPTTTMTTRRRLPPRTTRPVLVTNPTTEIPEVIPPDAFPRPVDYCGSTMRNGISWPQTSVSENARMPCLDGTGAVATWKCIREPSMREAAWHVAGPDLSKCITWASDVETKFNAGLIERASAFSSLASQISEETEFTEKSIQVATELMKKLLEDPTLPSKSDAKKIIESVTTISSKLLNFPESMKSMEKDEKTQLSNLLMNEIEKAAFLYADTVAMTPAGTRDNDPLIIAKDQVIIQVDVREKSLQSMTSGSVTSFPNEKTCAGIDNCGSDVIRLADSEILGQKGEGPATVVFALYNNLGDFLNQPDDVDVDDDDTKNDDVTNDVATWEIDSKVISATFRQPGYQTHLSKPAVIVLQHKKASHSPHRCVFWDYSESTNSGNWSDVGCRMTENNETHTTCECDHLTSFAVLVNHAGVTIAPIHDMALTIVTSVGISISIVCLLLCILTFSCFRNLYNDRNTIHKHLCICLLIAETIFLIGINQTQNKIVCSIIAGSLHYFFLAAFCWMALEGFQLYVMLVEVFEANSSRWKWYYLVGYGVPALIVGVSAGIDHAGYGTDSVCWLEIDSGFIWSFAGPILVIILLNLVFLSITVYKMYVHTMSFTDSGKINSIKASVRGASVLLCLLGITWAFGFLWISEHMTVVAYLFCIFNAFQGMFIFIFHCLLPRKVRQEYSRCFSRFPCCKNISRDTYVSNSMTFSKQYTPGRFAPNGTNGPTQQSSITGHSQLRRMWNETVAPKTSESSPIASEVSNNIVQNRGLKVTQSLSRELSKMRGVSLRDRSNSTSSFLYFYSVDKPKYGLGKPPKFGATEPRPRRSRSTIIANYYQRNTMTLSDSSRQPNCNHRMTSNLPQNSGNIEKPIPTRQQLQVVRQEDDVFLPSEHEFETRSPQMNSENVGLLQNEQDEIQYDRLHHHRHGDGNFHHDGAPFHSQHYPPPGHFHTGLPPAPRHHTHTSTGVHNHPRFGPTSHSQSRIRDMGDDAILDPNVRYPQSRHREPAHPYYWDLDAPLAHHHAHQSSLDDSLGNTKRDSGISMQHLPPNSMMHNLANEMHRNKVRSSHDNLTSGVQSDIDVQNHGMPRKVPYPIRGQNGMEAGQIEPGHQRFSPNHRRGGGFSDDEGQPSSYEDRENPQKYQTSSMDTQMPPHCAIHNPAVIPLSGRQDVPKSHQGGHRRRKSLSTDSDDPITSDCSPSSTGSFDKPQNRQYRQWTGQEECA